MKEPIELWKKALLVVASLTAIIGITVMSSAMANYILRAYIYPGSNSILRGYPTIDPPDNFTGTWVHYTYTGRPLAIHTVVNGRTLGKQIYLRDDGTAYLVRYLNKDGWERDEVNLGPPAAAVIPWFLPQRWINPSLDRLEFLDKLFPQQPTVFITEEPPSTKRNQRNDPQPIIPSDAAR